MSGERLMVFDEKSRSGSGDYSYAFLVDEELTKDETLLFTIGTEQLEFDTKSIEHREIATPAKKTPK